MNASHRPTRISRRATLAGTGTAAASLLLAGVRAAESRCLEPLRLFGGVSPSVVPASPGETVRRLGVLRNLNEPCGFLDEAFGSADNVGLRFRRPRAKAGRVANYVETEKREAGCQKIPAG
jgi:hypothetical protein